MIELEPITTTIDGFCRISGLGRTKVKQMLRDGRLQKAKVDGRTLVVIESYRRFIEAQLEGK